MGKERFEKSIALENSNSNGGLSSNNLMNTPLMQRKAKQQEIFNGVSASSLPIQRMIDVYGDRITTQNFTDQTIDGWYDLHVEVRRKIQSWVDAGKVKYSFGRWEDVVRAAQGAVAKNNESADRRGTRAGRDARINALEQAEEAAKTPFPVAGRVAQPNPFNIDAVKWWTQIAGFQQGDNYINSNVATYKKNVGAYEVHATIEVPETSNKQVQLTDYVKTQPQWLNRNNLRPAYTEGVNLNGWQTTLKKVTGWHISVKDGPVNKGGWFGLNRASSLPAYQHNVPFPQRLSAAEVANCLVEANNIRANMINNIF